MFKISLLVSMALICISCGKTGNQLSNPSYDPNTADVCPEADNLNRYIEVPIFYDLESHGAKVENIPGLNLHKEFLRPFFANKKVKLFYELDREYDPAKELLIVIPGGPGGDHSVLHRMKSRMPYIYDNYNVFAMDHRGVGCSRPTFPGDYPFQSMLMRFAAADIEEIRKQLAGENGKINVWGGSYGTMLGQTYALLYPDNLNKIILAGAFSAAVDFNAARRRYENLAVSSVPGFRERYLELKQEEPEWAHRFIAWTVGAMYQYEGRIKYIPETFDELRVLLAEGRVEDAIDLLPPYSFVMPWMTGSISCVEIFRSDSEFEDEFPMFPMFEYCREFAGHYEYFDYRDSLAKISQRVLLVSGFYDHVTPFEAMKQMSQRIPDNYLHVDPHLGHDAIYRKEGCLDKLFENYLTDHPNEDLMNISSEPQCQLPPDSM